jgi:hypothetical protein
MEHLYTEAEYDNFRNIFCSFYGEDLFTNNQEMPYLSWDQITRMFERFVSEFEFAASIVVRFTPEQFRTFIIYIMEDIHDDFYNLRNEYLEESIEDSDDDQDQALPCCPPVVLAHPQ